MNPPNATITNGRYGLPRRARGVLVLADPPEAGWRVRTPSDEQSPVQCDPLPAGDRKCDRKPACDGAPA